MEDRDAPSGRRLTFWQRMALRRIRRLAGKKADEPLTESDWAAIWQLHGEGMPRLVERVWSALPSSPRCGMCGAPFAGPGRFVVRPLGYRPSRKNPALCSTCVESSPPGGMKMDIAVLFADLRDFTASSEGRDPSDVSALLRRFYGCADRVLFPEAIIDKLIGDEVMALYLPYLDRLIGERRVPELALEHAHRLLEAVGYGGREGPFVTVGIGLDFGEAFVGNIGERASFDFTAVGDVVNTASRLQAEARSGEIVFSERVHRALAEPAGEAVELELKGKAEPEHAYRLAVAAG